MEMCELSKAVKACFVGGQGLNKPVVAATVGGESLAAAAAVGTESLAAPFQYFTH